MQLCCIPLRDLRNLRENIHVRVLNQSAQKKPQYSPADLADLRRQNPKTTLTTRCSSLRYNAALLHSSAWSALSAGEYSRKRTQSTLHTETPCVSRRSRRLSQTKPKTTTFQTVFLCEIMQLAAFSLRDLRYLRENIHASVLNLHCTKKPHVSPADFADSRRQNPKPHKTVFLCEIMQLAAFLCVICAICGRIHARGLKQSAQMKPQYLPQISQIYADKTTKQQHSKLSFSAIWCSLLHYSAWSAPSAGEQAVYVNTLNLL